MEWEWTHSTTHQKIACQIEHLAASLSAGALLAMTTCSQVSMLASFALGRGETTWVNSGYSLWVTMASHMQVPCSGLVWPWLAAQTYRLPSEKKSGQYEHCYNYVSNYKVLPANLPGNKTMSQLYLPPKTLTKHKTTRQWPTVQQTEMLTNWNG